MSGVFQSGYLVGKIKAAGNLKGSMSAPKIIGDTETVFILEDEAGTEVVGVLVDEVTAFDATENDIRTGKVAVTDSGVTVGTKEIPAYHTTEGARVIPKGQKIRIPIIKDERNLYDFTKLQVLICPFNGNVDGSVAVTMVAINDGVYRVLSSDKISIVIKDTESGQIDLDIINDSDGKFVVRFVTYKEIY